MLVEAGGEDELNFSLVGSVYAHEVQILDRSVALVWDLVVQATRGHDGDERLIVLVDRSSEHELWQLRERFDDIEHFSAIHGLNVHLVLLNVNDEKLRHRRGCND